jgi:DNA-directed RNA polymerase beta' subunit
MKSDRTRRFPSKFVLRPAKPDEILTASSGALRNSGFVDYEWKSGSIRPVPRGLYCPEIFGPLEGTLEADDRRERFGHIELMMTLNHPWFGTPFRYVPVVPPGYRRFGVTPEGVPCEHDLARLYGGLLAANAILQNLMKLGAPPDVLKPERNRLVTELARLMDNEACGEGVYQEDGRAPRGLAAHLVTDDPVALPVWLFAIGLVAERRSRG